MLSDADRNALYTLTRQYWLFTIGCKRILLGFLPWNNWKKNHAVTQIQKVMGYDNREQVTTLLASIIFLSMSSGSKEATLEKVVSVYHKKVEENGIRLPVVMDTIDFANIAITSLWDILRPATQ